MDNRVGPALSPSGDTGGAVFLLSSLTIGGSERKTINIANELHRRGVNVHVAYLNPPHTLLDSLQPSVPTICLKRKGMFSFSASKILHSYLSSQGVNTIFCVNLYPLVYAFVARILQGRQKSLKIVQLINTTRHVSRKAESQMLLYRPLLRRVDRIVFGCRAQMRLWCAEYRLDTSRCSVIYNGVDGEAYKPLSDDRIVELRASILGCSNSDFVVGTVGQLRPVKNQVEIIYAHRKLNDVLPCVLTVLVGDGPEREKIRLVCEEYSLTDEVRLLGQIDDVRNVISTMDVFVIPSISETFSNAALEAMAMGKVVVITDNGGAREMIDSGANGYTYDQGDVGSLTDILASLATDSTLRRRLGRNARHTVLQEFTFTQMVDSYQELITGQ